MLRLLRILADVRGAAAIEYALIAALIATAAIASISRVGTKLGTTFNNVSSKLV